VQKEVKHFPDDPGYVLGIIPRFPWYAFTTNGACQKLVEQIASQVQYAGYTYIIALEKNYRPLRRKFKRIAGAEILKGVKKEKGEKGRPEKGGEENHW
jgi:hypothetical protein